MGGDRCWRIGLLGAAKIAPAALILPAQQRDDVEVVAIAARDRRRAEEFAHLHGVQRVHGTYGELLADGEVDAVYNPLPNGLHGRWSMAALRSGKDVLCEKPIAANAEEARAMMATARRTGRILMEAFHYAYHPLTRRWLALLEDGAIGELRRVGAAFRTSIPLDDVRYQFAQAGGAMMDLGCYCAHAVRWVLRDELRVTRATARLGAPDVDAALNLEVVTPTGKMGTLECDMASEAGFAARLSIEGTRGTLEVDNPFVPHLGHRLEVRGRVDVNEEVAGGTTYDYQLDAFVAALRSRRSVLTSGDDSVATMQVVDAAYAAAGLPLREPAT